MTTDVYPAGLDWVPDWTLAVRRAPALVPRHVERAAGRARCAPRCSSTTTRRSRSARGARSSTALARRPTGRSCWSRRSRIPTIPYEVPRRLWERYDGCRDRAACGSVAAARRAGSAQPAAARDVRRTIGSRQTRSARAPRGAAYAAAISLVDEHVASLLATLEERGDGRRHDRRRHLRPRRHARRARALVQDVVLRRVGAGAAHRAPSRPRRAAAREPAGLAARRRARRSSSSPAAGRTASPRPRSTAGA